MLTADNLTLGYDADPIVKNLSLSISQGQVIALVGPNGCGKSTLLRGLARLLQPRDGAILVDGKAIQHIPTKQLARQIGVLPQNLNAPEGLTVRELVAQGRFPHQTWYQQWSEADEKATNEALRITKMLPLADRPLDTLSGGQRQRAWIAMALAQETDILLLDEPTTFLDMAHQMEILDLLQELNQAGRTIVMVLHDLNQACRYADCLVAMKDGQIYASGSPAEVMSPQLVRDVFGIGCCLIADPITRTPLCIPLGRAARQAEAA